MRVASRYDKGIYVYTHTKIEEGVFKGSHKISWLNDYDYTVVGSDATDNTLQIEISEILARSKGLIK